MFGKLFIFGSGVLVGIYIDQKYQVPDLEKTYNFFSYKYLKEKKKKN